MFQMLVTAIDPSLEFAVAFISMILALISFSYAFHQRGIFFIIPESVYLGAITAHALMGIYKGIKATALDYIAQGQLQLIIPLIIGILAFTRLTKYRWLARYPVALMTGAGTGALFALTIKGQFIAQIADTITQATNPLYDPISQIIVVAFCIPVMAMFLYSRQLSGIFHERSGSLYWVQRIGQLIFFIFLAVKGGLSYDAGTGWPVRLIQQVVKPVLEQIFGIG